jgi:lipopolysaccharide/colanic/teichoic acid biosynthesis glycosyltransferase
MSTAYDRAKRALDLAIALPTAVILAPFVAGFAAAVRLETPGPIFFRQERIGIGGRPFEILKLRTLYDEPANRPADYLVSAGDQRITRVGAFLRRWSLDELPQLWNIIRGDMSVVGPRPTLGYQVEQYTPHQRRRLEVLPGVTGWAQIHGRNSVAWPQRIELDVWYVDHRSLRLDLKILLRTPGTLVRPGPVYGDVQGDWGERKLS